MKVLVTWIAPVETLLLFNFRLFQLMFCNRMKCLIRRLKTHSGEWKESQNDKRITTSHKWRDRFFRLSFQSFTIYHSSSSWLLPSSSHFAFFFIWTICALHNDTIPSIFSILLYFSLLKDKLNRTSNIPKYELNCDNKKKPTNNYVKLHWKGRRTCRERKCNKIFKNNFFSSCFFPSSLLALPFGFSFPNYRCSYKLNNYFREATKRNWFWSMRLYSFNPCSLQTLNEKFVEKNCIPTMIWLY